MGGRPSSYLRRRIGWGLALGASSIALAWSGSVAGLYFAQPILMYHPLPGSSATPADAGLSYEAVTLHTPDGERLAAWWVPAARARGTLLYCHGSGANLGYRVRILELLHRLEVDVLIFDYRGFGESTGDPDEAGTYEDAATAWRWLTRDRGIPPHRIVIYGRSMGGAVASWLAAREKPAGLVIDSSFTSLPDLVRDTYPSILVVPSLIEYRYPTADHLAAVRAPVLLAHSPADDEIPYAHAEELWRAIPGSRRWLELRGGHGEGPFAAEEEYLRALETFLAEALPPTAANVQP